MTEVHTFIAERNKTSAAQKQRSHRAEYVYLVYSGYIRIYMMRYGIYARNCSLLQWVCGLLASVRCICAGGRPSSRRWFQPFRICALLSPRRWAVYASSLHYVALEWMIPFYHIILPYSVSIFHSISNPIKTDWEESKLIALALNRVLRLCFLKHRFGYGRLYFYHRSVANYKTSNRLYMLPN